MAGNSGLAFTSSTRNEDKPLEWYFDVSNLSNTIPFALSESKGSLDFGSFRQAQRERKGQESRLFHTSRFRGQSAEIFLLAPQHSIAEH